MATINDVYAGLTKIGNNIAKKGGTMISQNLSYSLEELAQGVMSIPEGERIVLSDTDTVIVYEMPNTTISVYDLEDTLIGSQTTPASTGGEVNIEVPEAGTYRVVATKNGAEFWNRQIAINGPTIVKTSLSLDDYTEDEIENSCVNHYAHNMFNVLDYRTVSFMGSSNQKKYILGFNVLPLEGGGTAEIAWGYLDGTPSSYKFDSVNSNTCSWIGSDMRDRCLPSGSDKYKYNSSVTSSTSGTYYVYDFTNDTWVEKTLPDDFVEGENYYVKSQTASDGVFYTSALSANEYSHVKNVINYTWTGHVKGQTTTSTNITSDKLIKTVDKLFLPSPQQFFGVKPMNGQYWCFNQNEGEFMGLPFNKLFGILNNKSKWFRSPSSNSASTGCYWNNSYGYVYNYTITSTYSALLCYGQ